MQFPFYHQIRDGLWKWMDAPEDVMLTLQVPLKSQSLWKWTRHMLENKGFNKCPLISVSIRLLPHPFSWLIG